MNMKQNRQERKEVSREPWWTVPPKIGQVDLDLKWGYLVFYDDNTCEFDQTERPTDNEIINRSGSKTAGHGL